MHRYSKTNRCGLQVSYILSATVISLGSWSIPWPDQIGNSEKHTENDAKAADNNVCNPQERILSANHASSGDQDTLGAVVDVDWEDCDSQHGRNTQKESLTIIDVHLIDAGCHSIVVISQSEFAESRQAGGSHPNLELFVLGQIWNGVLIGIAIWITKSPIWRGCSFIVAIICLSIQFRVTGPCNALVGHGICLTLLPSSGVDVNGGVQGVVEQGVCNQATRVDWFAVRGKFDRIA